MKIEITKKASIVLIIFTIIVGLLGTVKVFGYNKLDYPTWRIDENLPLEEIGIRAIARYRRDYDLAFDEVTFDGDVIYGATPQGMVVTDYHIVYAVCVKKSATEYNGYLYFIDKNTKKIDFALPVYDGEESTEYGHMNGMTYNPDAKKLLIPWYYTKEDDNMVKKIAIFSYNSEGKLESNVPEIIDQPEEIFAQDMAYDRDEKKYVFNGYDRIWKIPSAADGTLEDNIVEQFKFNISDNGNLHDNIWGKQDIEVYGNYIYKGYYEPGVGDGHEASGYLEEKDDTYHYDPSERFSNVIGVYNKYNGNLEKALYIPNTSVAGELEGISFDSDGTMVILYSQMIFGASYAVLYTYNETDNTVNVRRDIPVNEFGAVIPKATITGEATSVEDGMIRYYNGNNNLGDDHSNYTTTWKDLSNNQNGKIKGSPNAVIARTANGIIRGEETFSDNGCMVLDGIDDWINIGYLPNEVYENTTFEMQFILNDLSNNAEDSEIDLISNDGYRLFLKNGKIQFRAKINNEYKSVIFNEKLLTGRIYNISAIFNGRALLLYIDGVLRNTTIISETQNYMVDVSDNTITAIGAKPVAKDAVQNYMNGEIYSARIYNKVLTEEEIRKNMNADRITSIDLPCNKDNLTITINFSEPVMNFSIDDIIVTNGTKEELVQISNKKYNLNITDIIAGEQLKISIDDGSFTDLYGRNGIGTAVIRTRDVEENVNIIANTGDATSEDTITYTIEFDDLVTDFSEYDIMVINGVMQSFSEIEKGKKYILEVSNTGNTTQTIKVPSSVCFDRSGNSNKEAIKTIIIDKTAPIISGVENNAVYYKKITPEITDLETGIKQIILIKDGEQVEYQIGQDIIIGGEYELSVIDEAENETKVNFTIEKTTNKIEMLSMPTKTTYLQNYEDLNLTGGKIKASYSDTTQEEIDLTDERIEVTGFSNVALGEIEITVKFDEKETSFKVNIESTQPVITISPSSCNYVKNIKMTITAIGEKIDLSDINDYQFAISDSNKKVPEEGWQNYTSGQTMTIGEGLTGEKYVWVKQVIDKAGNKSIINQVSGPYLFDNTAPIVTGAKDGEIYEDMVVLHTEDNDSGIKSIIYTRYGGYIDYTDGIEITRKGIYAIKVTDNVGNVTIVNFEKRDKVLFTDISETEWYYSAIKYVFQNNIIRGYDDYTFAPNDNLTRGMMVTILHRMEGKPEVSGTSKFPDVQDEEKYYYQAVKWATDNKIVNGYNEGTFGPDDNILRQDLATILRNYARYKNKNINVTASLTNFKDYQKVDNYANTSMQWAVGSKVITGNKDGTLNPKGNATRAETASMLKKYCDNVGR